MLERLSVRHQTRLDNSLTRRSDSSNSSESTSTFLSRFSDIKRAIESQLAESRQVAISDPVRLKSHLDSVSSSISDLEKLVAENSYFLPSYEVRSSLKNASDLRQSLENLTAKLVPRKKFSFKNKSTTKKELPKEQVIEKSDPGSVQTSSHIEIRDLPGFRNKANEILEQRFNGTKIGELSDVNLNEAVGGGEPGHGGFTSFMGNPGQGYLTLGGYAGFGSGSGYDSVWGYQGNGYMGGFPGGGGTNEILEQRFRFTSDILIFISGLITPGAEIAETWWAETGTDSGSGVGAEEEVVETGEGAETEQGRERLEVFRVPPPTGTFRRVPPWVQ